MHRLCRHVNWTRLNVIYESIMLTLVVLSLAAVMTKGETVLKDMHYVVWTVFLIDVIVRFTRATYKWYYIKHNTADILSVIPLEDLFLAARFARFIKLFRYKNLIKRYLDKIDEWLTRIGFWRVTWFTIGLLILISLILYASTSQKPFESVVWVFTNFLTFNYQKHADALLWLSVLLKIGGILYMGILLNKLLNTLKRCFDRWKAHRRKKHQNAC